MAILTIPKEYEAGIAVVLTSSDEAIQELSAALGSAPLIFKYQDLAEHLAETVKNLSPSAIDDMIEMLVSFHSLRTTAEVPLPEFLEDVAEGVGETDLKETLVKCPPEKFKQRLGILLSVKALAFSADARVIQKNYENTFCTGQMLTDIRPIFGSNGDKNLVAAVLTHTLKISYHQGNSIKDFFLAVDSDGLDSLDHLITQARLESASLKSILDVAKIPYPSESE
jgi:hypothetical protein